MMNLKYFTILATLLLSPSLTWATSIPDTGQTKCYDNTHEIICPNPGENFYGQDAQYPCNPQAYTKLDENGNNLPDDALGWSMVRDNVTGLIWENKTDDESFHDYRNAYNWSDAQSIFIATINNSNFGGYHDWRLPTVKELSFIRNLNTHTPDIDTTYFPNVAASWSSTVDASDPSLAWHVYFDYGRVTLAQKIEPYRLRAVRGVQCGSSDSFIDNADSTVTDTSAGLMWELKTDDGGPRDKDNTYNWQQALSYCENLTLADYGDWRLPNVNELETLVEYSKHDPAIDTVYFPNTMPYYYWSSTSSVWDPHLAWHLSFIEGGVNFYNKDDDSLYVRCVRGIECGSFGDPDSDCIVTYFDNCPTHPNGSNLGICVKPVSGVVLSYGAELTPPPIFIPCTSDDACTAQGSYCDLAQGDFNTNGIGDACECYADCDCNQKVDLADLVLMKGQFTWNCSQHPSCEADCNGDGKVDLSDLVIMKIQFLRTDCPACP